MRIRGLKKSVIFILLAAVFTAAFLNSASGQVGSLVLAAFSSGAIPPGWKPYRFPNGKPQTEYSVVKDGDRHVLKATSNGAASAFFIEFGDDPPSGLSVMEWSWKVKGVLPVKEGEADDYPARVYVTFAFEPEKATAFEKIKRKLLETVFGVELPGSALTYVWANRLPKGSQVYSPYTKKMVTVAVESGEGLAGRWVREERDILDDYRKYLSSEPPRMTGVAVMTDTDNTGTSAEAWYGDIILKSERTLNQAKEAQ